MGIVSFLTVRIVEIIVVILLIVFMPNIPPKANFSYYKVSPAPNLEGKIALNTRLNGVQRIYENELKGAESFAEYNGELYTSLFTGEVVKLSKGHIVPIAKFGKPCAGYIEESICGRPLGLAFDKNGILYVADAYMGIWKLDVKTGHKTQLVSMEQEIEGKKPLIPNSIVISQNGDLYWTDSSTDFKLEDGVYSMLADGSGRLLHYDMKTKTSKVLMDNIHFANGIILSPDEDFLVVSESAQSRLNRYYLKGPKKGTHDIFIDGLPGIPDNLNSDGQNGFFVSFVLTRDADHPIISQIFGPFPLIRKFFARIIALTELGFKTLHRIYPTVYSQTAIHWIGHFESITILMIQRATILRLSYTGEILDCMHATDDSVSGLSETKVFGDHLYLGSPFNNYIGKIPLSKVGLEQLARKKREVPVKQSPSPTAAPHKKTPPPTAAPTKPPTKQTPPPTTTTTSRPTKKTPAPTQAPVKQTPPPTPVREPSPVRESTPAPAKQTPVPTKAPTKQTPPPTVAPIKQTPSSKQSPPPTQTPVKQTPHPTQAPAKQTPPPTQAPVKQSPPPTQAPVKQTPPPAQQKPKESEKETLKVVPVKENTVPKSESIKPRK